MNVNILAHSEDADVCFLYCLVRPCDGLFVVLVVSGYCLQQTLRGQGVKTERTDKERQ